MSWSSSYPPPRRSRSRSPSSRPYPPRPLYPDGGYAQDSYRPEWDYDRDRWYERDRAAYDYGRRGRSRSPPADEPNRKRRRSLSPYERDRYDPRPRYNDDYDAHSRGHGYMSPRRGYPYPPSRRAPPDPYAMDYPATLKQFAEWFRYTYPQLAIDEDNADKAAEQEAGDGSKPRNGLKTRWEKYKKEFAATQLQTMFDHHRKSPWFAEKYDPAPEYQNLRTRVRKEGWRNRLSAFLIDLENGKFDPEYNEIEAEPASPVKESSSVSDNVNNPDANGNHTTSDDAKAAGDDDMQFNIDADEDAVDGDGQRQDANGKTKNAKDSAKGGEEVSVMPEGNQVMIRTIPPDIGRVKLEEACGRIPGFVYLALGDPLQKRNYYRAGWIRFTEDADMPTVLAELSERKIEGFKLHVTHNMRPFTGKVRYAPEVASRPERLEKDLGNAKVLAGMLEEEATRLRKAKISELKKGEPSPKGATTAKASSATGGAGGGNAESAGGEKANGSGSTSGGGANADGVGGAGGVGDAAANGVEEDTTMGAPEDEEEEEEEPRERGSDAVERRIEKIMADLKDQGVVDPNDDKAYAAKKTLISLDLYLAYLRAAFHTCYYCSVVTDHLEELQRKCLKHVRKPLSKSMLEDAKSKEEEGAGAEKDKEGRKDKDAKRNDERWLDWLDSKIALLINRDGVDPRDYGGKSYDEELSKLSEPYMKQEDEGKFRCKQCLKLFRATSFVEKHIANKHPDIVKSLEELPYFNNFALDPHRIQPFTHPPAPTGNSSQIPPPQAYGLQGPPAYYGPDYGRGPGAPPFYGAPYPPPPPGAPPYHNGYWDYHYPPPPPPHHHHHAGANGPYGPPLFVGPGGGGSVSSTGSGAGAGSRRDEGTMARKLSDRISGFAIAETGGGGMVSTLPAAAGLPPKPSAAALDSALSAGSGGGRRRGGTTGGGGGQALPPADAKEDPRAAAGKRVSYHDMDLVAEGDVELSY